MLSSLALIFIVGLFFSALCKIMKIPGLVGMLFTGILLGSYGLKLLDPSILSISADLRTIALIIILLRAGFSLDFRDLKKIGRPALLMAFLPASFEIVTYFIFAPIILGLSLIESALMGTVLAAVSPAVVVPRMVMLIEKRFGTKKGIPQLIMAGASCDDVFVIVLFTTFLSMAQGNTVRLASLIKIPASIFFGIIAGLMAGYLLYVLFETAYVKKKYVRNSLKIIIILGVSFLLISAEKVTFGFYSGLLAIISMASMLKAKSTPFVSRRLSQKFGKLWLAAELMLFVLVGAAVDIRYTLSAGVSVLIMIFLALIFRSIGVLFCLVGTGFSLKEKLFCVLAYLPKATVQAAIGAVPLAAGLPSGKIILSVAVLSILVTAPLGAFAIDANYKKVLEKETAERS
jgi:NhaP-type Na+/H+ or K+/H+ antiporter